MEKIEHHNSPGNPLHLQTHAGHWSEEELRMLPEDHRRGVEGAEEGQREHGAKVSQPEPQNCDPPRRALLEEKKKKKKVEWLLRDFVFRAHISHSYSTVAVFRALGFQFCSM